MKIKILLTVLFLYCTAALMAQDYVGKTVLLGSSAGTEKYLAGSLPKHSASVYQKLKIVINGGSWHNKTTAENHYFISTRDGIKINQEVHGGSYSRYELKVYENGANYDFVIAVNAAYPSFNIRSWNIDGNGYVPIAINRYDIDGKIDVTQDVTVNQMFITSNEGNIGMGKTPSSTTKLDVAGTIRADEIKVEDIAAINMDLSGDIAANNITIKTNGQTADFVFESDYQLKDLSEVETFIKTNKHLENIPSAREMEEQGVNLAEMNKLLLQKVEELTLHLIEKDKEVKSQMVTVDSLEEALSKEQSARDKVEEKVSTMENEIQAIKELILNK